MPSVCPHLTTVYPHFSGCRLNGWMNLQTKCFFFLWTVARLICTLRSDLKGTLKNLKICIGCTLIFLGCCQALICLGYSLDFFLIYKYETQLFSSCHPEKKTGRSYPKTFRQRPRKIKARRHPRKIRVQIKWATNSSRTKDGLHYVIG